MFTFVLTLHVLAAVFVIGPLVGAATTAARGIRTANAAEIDYAVRTTRVYTIASFVVIIFGFGLLGMQDTTRFRLGQPWIYLSLLMWVIAVAVSLGLVVPGLERSSKVLEDGGGARAIATYRGRVAAGGGAMGLLFVAVVVLMVTRPGA